MTLNHSPKNETSEIKIISVNNSDYKLEWERRIFEKENRYSPSMQKIQLINSNELISIYTIPNDTNRNIILNKIELSQGNILATKKLNIKTDNFGISDVMEMGNELYIVGRACNFVTLKNPFKSNYWLGALFKIDKENLNLIETDYFGSEYTGTDTNLLRISKVDGKVYGIQTSEYILLQENFPVKRWGLILLE